MHPRFEEIYLRELLIQCEYALVGVAHMEALIKDGPAALFFREAQGFLSYAAAVSRILWPPRVPDSSKRQRANSRGSYLRTVLGIGEDHVLHKRTLRDHLEHFDERLDQWAQETTHRGFVDLCIGPATAVIAGPAIGRGDFFRVFEPGRKVFTFRGEEFDIQELVTGVEGVKKAVLERFPVVEKAVQQAVAADDPAAGKSE